MLFQVLIMSMVSFEKKIRLFVVRGRKVDHHVLDEWQGGWRWQPEVQGF